MNNIYDYILIGAGPTNLTIATFCSIYKIKCLILEKENEIEKLEKHKWTKSPLYRDIGL
jgi:thioredoxin reductase